MTASVPIVTVLVEGVTFAPPGGTHDELVELVEVVHQLGAGRIRGEMQERRYDLFEDGTRVLTGIETISAFAAQGADAAVILQRSALHDDTCNDDHTKESHR